MSRFVGATRLVAEREVRTLVRTKGFWIGFGVVVVGLFALSILPTVFGDGPQKVAAVGTQAVEALADSGLEVREVSSVDEAAGLVRSEDVEAAVVPDGSGVKVLALNDPPNGVVAALRTAPPVELLDASVVGQGPRTVVIMVFAVVFLIFGAGGAAIAQSTVVEKQTRIVEILVSTVPVRALLAGKIAGHTVLMVGQAVVLAVAAPIALRLGGHHELLAVVGPALGWFVPFLVLGFLLLAGMWAMAGALVSRQEDLGSTMGVVMMLVIGPYFAVMMFNEDAGVLQVLSYVPFTSAIAMPVRMFAQQAAAWEAVLSLGLLAATVVLIVLGASRVYSGALLHTGGKLALRKAWAREA
ncbi:MULTISPECIES: ABC transporter permease [unclassified Saccharothrix]|uniref:ABC transporter permease n=1 Tax=unclassified Saccharothrix TaxID=2593673 RepID=UPI00307D4F22